MIGQYSVQGKIGQGGFGTVYRVQSKVDNNAYVMKEV